MEAIYASMRRGRDIDSARFTGRRLCLPFALRWLFPDNMGVRELLEGSDCPYTMDRVGEFTGLFSVSLASGERLGITLS